MLTATLMDPSIGSANIGDQIIRQKVVQALEGVVQIGNSLPTQTRLKRPQRKIAAAGSLAIVGGTNLLSSNMPWYQQWKVDPLSIHALRGKVVLLGVGWWQYQGHPNLYTRKVLDSLLSRDFVHSVRDSYTAERLTDMGHSVLNTACPTMWNLDEISDTSMRAARCIVTLTDYNKNVSEDEWLLALTASLYSEVIVWPQSSRDAAYARTLKGEFSIADPTLSAYDELLAGGDVDYVGTRLHGGIRAFDSGVWGLIVAVDNRAIEIGKDTGLPVYPRGAREEIDAALRSRRKYAVTLPSQNILSWSSQFDIS